MGKIAFVFSGQGDQFPGMGRDLYDRYPAAKELFDFFEQIRPGTMVQCFSASEEELRKTRNTQPCLFAMELAAAAVLQEKGIYPDMAAGFSLGELSAAAVSGVFDFETGFRLVCRRGALMQKQAEQADTFMAAVLKVTAEQVEEICGNYPDIYPVNYNCPGQTTVAGLSSQRTDFLQDIKKAGGRVVLLKVNGAFHSPFMEEAAKAFGAELEKVRISRPRFSLYADMTGARYGDDVIGLLSSQICSPVQWEKTIRRMLADGADTFIEIGPGKTLTNMIRKISPEINVITVMEYLGTCQASHET